MPLTTANRGHLIKPTGTARYYFLFLIRIKPCSVLCLIRRLFSLWPPYASVILSSVPMIPFNCLGVFSLAVVYDRDVVVCRYGVRVIFTQLFFTDSQSLLIPLKRLGIVALAIVYASQVVVYRGGFQVLLA